MDTRLLRQLIQKAFQVRLVGVPVLDRLRRLLQFRQDRLQFVRGLVVVVRRAAAQSPGGACGDRARHSTTQRSAGQARQAHLTEGTGAGRDRRRAPALVYSNTVAASLTAGLATAQLGGTDNAPARPALPRPAVTADAPTAPTAGVLEPSEANSGPSSSTAVSLHVRAVATRPKLRLSNVSLTGRMPLVTNSMFAAIFANGVEFRLFNHVANDDGSAAGSAEGDAKLCSVRGVDDISCAKADCALAGAVPAAWATAPDWPAPPAGLVVCGGALKGSNCAAIAEDPA